MTAPAVTIAKPTATPVDIQLKVARVRVVFRGRVEVGTVYVDGRREGDVVAADVTGTVEVDVPAVGAVDVEVPGRGDREECCDGREDELHVEGEQSRKVKDG